MMRCADQYLGCRRCVPCLLDACNVPCLMKTRNADGTFEPEGAARGRSAARGGMALAATATLALAMVALVYANTSSDWPGSALMSEGQRTTKLAWGGFTLQMQDEADKALRLCKVGLMGPNQHCATHVVSTDDTKWTHSDAGQPTWEESQMVLSRQVRVRPLSAGVGCGVPACVSCRAGCALLFCPSEGSILHPSSVSSRTLLPTDMRIHQSSIIPRGPDIGTPGDFGDRR